MCFDLIISHLLKYDFVIKHRPENKVKISTSFSLYFHTNATIARGLGKLLTKVCICYFVHEIVGFFTWFCWQLYKGESMPQYEREVSDFYLRFHSFYCRVFLFVGPQMKLIYLT